MLLEKEHGIQIAVEVFDIKCHQLSKVRNPNIFMQNSKELFSDWFEDGIPYPITHLGANDHPDCIIEGVGFELKSKLGNGQIQFNSTIPTGRFKRNRPFTLVAKNNDEPKVIEGECYYAISRYIKDRNFGQLIDFTITYGDYFNFDHDFAHAHMNSQENHFGDYGDGVVRYRKMYAFPTPTKDVPGVSLILDTDNAEEINTNLILESSVDRVVKATGEIRTFFVYRHRLITS